MSSSRKHLPPLSALRSFEAAARLGSFKAAAAELGVTPSAVSHQLRDLESRLGVRLFDRKVRAVSLTSLGEAYAEGVVGAFEQLSEATSQLFASGEATSIRISAAPVLATTILAGLGDSVHPEGPVRMELDVSDELADVVGGAYHLAIRIGKPPWPGLEHELVMRPRWTPVCSPGRAAGRELAPSDLLREPLLKIKRSPDAWPRFFAMAGVAFREPRTSISFETFSGAVRAAEEGVGFVLAPRQLVTNLVAEKRLAAPCDLELESEEAYYLVYPRGQAHSRRVSVTRRYLNRALKMTEG